MTRSGVFALAAALVLAAAPVSAQSLKSLSGSALSGGSSAGANALASDLASGSVSIGGAENTAGTLAYCQQQGYTAGGVSAVRNKLLSKLGGLGAVAKTAGYASGAAGMLQAGDGASFDLSALKGAIGKKVCAAIAEQATSTFLSG